MCSQLITRGSKQDECYLAPPQSTELGHRDILPSARLTIGSHLNEDHGLTAQRVHTPCAQVEGHRPQGIELNSSQGWGPERSGKAHRSEAPGRLDNRCQS